MFIKTKIETLENLVPLRGQLLVPGEPMTHIAGYLLSKVEFQSVSKFGDIKDLVRIWNNVDQCIAYVDIREAIDDFVA